VEFNECPFVAAGEPVLEDGTTVRQRVYDNPGRPCAPFYKVVFENGGALRSALRLVMSEVEARGHVILMVRPSDRPRNKKMLEEYDAEYKRLGTEIEEKEKEREQLQLDSKNGIESSIATLCAREKSKKPNIEEFEKFRVSMEDILMNLADRCGLKEEPLQVKDVANRMHPVISLHYNALSLLYDEEKQKEMVFLLFKQKYANVKEAIQLRTAMSDATPKNGEEATEEEHEEDHEQDFSYPSFAADYKKDLKDRVEKEFPVGNVVDPHDGGDSPKDPEEELLSGDWQIVTDKNGNKFYYNSKTYDQRPLTEGEMKLVDSDLGSSQAVMDSASKPIGSAVSAPKKLTCGKCGTSLSPCAKFCGECGTKVEPKKKFCPNCGTPCEGKFCQECGGAIQ